MGNTSVEDEPGRAPDDADEVFSYGSDTGYRVVRGERPRCACED